MNNLYQAESALQSGERPKALQHILKVLEELALGKLGRFYDSQQHEFIDSEESLLFCTRVAAAIAGILSNQPYEIDPDSYTSLCNRQELVESLFLHSSYKNSVFLFRLIGHDDGIGNTNINSLSQLMKYLSVTPLNIIHQPLAELLAQIPPSVASAYIAGTINNHNELTAHGREMRELILQSG